MYRYSVVWIIFLYLYPKKWSIGLDIKININQLVFHLRKVTFLKNNLFPSLVFQLKKLTILDVNKETHVLIIGIYVNSSDFNKPYWFDRWSSNFVNFISLSLFCNIPLSMYFL